MLSAALYLALAAAVALAVVLRRHQASARLRRLPVVDSTKLTASGAAANDFDVLLAGYQQYSRAGRNFLWKSAAGTRFIAASKHIDQIRSAADDQLSILLVENETFQVRYTLHPALAGNCYEFDTVRTLTKNLGVVLPALLAECDQAVRAQLDEPTTWRSTSSRDLACRVICRTGNRAFFGPGLAANAEFCDLSLEVATVVVQAAHWIRQWPALVRPLLVRFGTTLPALRSRLRAFIEPLILERIAADELARRKDTLQDWEQQKPADIVQWLLDITPPNRRHHVDEVIARMMHLVVAAIHTSTYSLMEAIDTLAQHPEIHEELCDEIRSVHAKYGNFGKQALHAMVKLDSTMREIARWSPFVGNAVERLALRDFVLQDDDVVPKGMTVSVAQHALHFDPDVYGPTADQFDAFRFSRQRAEAGHEAKHSFAQTSTSWLHFGHGRHACPGRFFASEEIKLILAYLLTRFEMRWPEGQAAPTAFYTNGFRFADGTRKVEWKLRASPLVDLGPLQAE